MKVINTTATEDKLIGKSFRCPNCFGRDIRRKPAYSGGTIKHWTCLDCLFNGPAAFFADMTPQGCISTIDEKPV